MQPEDPKQDFQNPSEANYFAPASAPSEQPESTDATAPPSERNSSTSPSQSLDSAAHEAVQWRAPEYLHHEKGVLWFIVFGFVVIALTVAAVFLIKSWTFALLIPVMAVALIAYSYRPPHEMDYVVSGKGLYINDTLHPFAEFKAFGVIEDSEYSLVFIPVRRFRPSLTVYFPQEKGEAIVDVLGVRLPMQPLKLDTFDKIVRSLGL